ncbi:uncharacterized protein MONBRDRAFT_27155 [Monosiga brevicollis MX1]|uniref:Protein kinase domain-containing protein n=1 Tax=Monosiga brevicollis TaxID=81824 RepID=A9V4G9_MONBE|nr:uncharacterized protein MONBRDRAFT_27155 [Monosiga brevicollis MX1]EDQ87613.1 predicted protein [Monosiga brevicollis MX1]|eukprot:XP_001747533.1 hypothetical protein [Monosiga brevicollis MX1]
MAQLAWAVALVALSISWTGAGADCPQLVPRFPSANCPSFSEGALCPLFCSRTNPHSTRNGTALCHEGKWYSSLDCGICDFCPDYCPDPGVVELSEKHRNLIPLGNPCRDLNSLPEGLPLHVQDITINNLNLRLEQGIAMNLTELTQFSLSSFTTSGRAYTLADDFFAGDDKLIDIAINSVLLGRLPYFDVPSLEVMQLAELTLVNLNGFGTFNVTLANSRWPKLKTLTISDLGFQGRIIGHMEQAWPQLEVMQVSALALSEMQAFNWSRLPNLKELSMYFLNGPFLLDSEFLPQSADLLSLNLAFYNTSSMWFVSMRALYPILDFHSLGFRGKEATMGAIVLSDRVNCISNAHGYSYDIVCNCSGNEWLDANNESISDYKLASHCPQANAMACEPEWDDIIPCMSPEERAAWGGEFIFPTQVCDGVPDCTNGRDEGGCQALTDIYSDIPPNLGNTYIPCTRNLTVTFSKGTAYASSPLPDCYTGRGIVLDWRRFEFSLGYLSYRGYYVPSIQAFQGQGILRRNGRGDVVNGMSFQHVLGVVEGGLLDARSLTRPQTSPDIWQTPTFDYYFDTSVCNLSSTLARDVASTTTGLPELTERPPAVLSSRKSDPTVLAAAVAGGAGCLALVAFVIVLMRRRSGQRHAVLALHSSYRTAMDRAIAIFCEAHPALNFVALHELSWHQMEVIEVVGSGNFGRVLKAKLFEDESRKLTSLVAVKEPVDLMLNEVDALSDFLKEAMVLQAIASHPNVVGLHGVCLPNSTVNRHCALVCEYCEFGELKALLVQQHSALQSVAVQRRVALQMCSAMAFLASKGIIHRDLAARNVLVARLQPISIRLADFGLSRLVSKDDYYRSRGKDGLPFRWMAPEAIRELRFSQASDVWSLGVVVWEVLHHGQTPYGSLDGHHIVQLLLQGSTLSMEPGVDPLLSEFCFWCWQRAASARPSFADLKDQLEAGYIPPAPRPLASKPTLTLASETVLPLGHTVNPQRHDSLSSSSSVNTALTALPSSGNFRPQVLTAVSTVTTSVMMQTLRDRLSRTRRSDQRKSVGSVSITSFSASELQLFEALQVDLADWINQTGVILIRLARIVDTEQTRFCQEQGRPWKASRLKCNSKATKDSFFARDNVLGFLAYASKFMDKQQLFDCEDLLGRQNKEAVFNCIHMLLRNQQGMLPTRLLEVEAAANGLSDTPLTELVADETIMLAALRSALANAQGDPQALRIERPGYYVLRDGDKAVCCHLVDGVVLVKTDKHQWKSVLQYLETPAQHRPHLMSQKRTSLPANPSPPTTPGRAPRKSTHTVANFIHAFNDLAKQSSQDQLLSRAGSREHLNPSPRIVGPPVPPKPQSPAPPSTCAPVPPPRVRSDSKPRPRPQSSDEEEEGDEDDILDFDPLAEFDGPHDDSDVEYGHSSDHERASPVILAPVAQQVPIEMPTIDPAGALAAARHVPNLRPEEIEALHDVDTVPLPGSRTGSQRLASKSQPAQEEEEVAVKPVTASGPTEQHLEVMLHHAEPPKPTEGEAPNFASPAWSRRTSDCGLSDGADSVPESRRKLSTGSIAELGKSLPVPKKLRQEAILEEQHSAATTTPPIKARIRAPAPVPQTTPTPNPAVAPHPVENNLASTAAALAPLESDPSKAIQDYYGPDATLEAPSKPAKPLKPRLVGRNSPASPRLTTAPVERTEPVSMMHSTESSMPVINRPTPCPQPELQTAAPAVHTEALPSNEAPCTRTAPTQLKSSQEVNGAAESVAPTQALEVPNEVAPTAEELVTQLTQERAAHADQLRALQDQLAQLQNTRAREAEEARAQREAQQRREDELVDVKERNRATIDSLEHERQRLLTQLRTTEQSLEQLQGERSIEFKTLSKNHEETMATALVREQQLKAQLAEALASVAAAQAHAEQCEMALALAEQRVSQGMAAPSDGTTRLMVPGFGLVQVALQVVAPLAPAATSSTQGVVTPVGSRGEDDDNGEVDC